MNSFNFQMLTLKPIHVFILVFLWIAVPEDSLDKYRKKIKEIIIQFLSRVIQTREKKSISNASSSADSENFDAAISKANLLYESLNPQFNSLKGWSLQLTKDGVDVSIKQDPNSALNTFRGDGVLHGAAYSLQEVLSVIKSPSARKEWDKRYDEGKLLKQLDKEKYLVYHSQKGIFPFAGRDFLTVGAVKRINSNQLQYISTSVNHKGAPSDPSKVRAHLHLGAWNIQVSPVTNLVHLTYMVQVDIGASIPSAVLNIIQTQTPLVIAEIDKYLATKGPLPFIIQNNEKSLFDIMEESFDAKTQAYKVKVFNPSESRECVLALPKIRYPGCKIEIQGLKKSLLDQTRVDISKNALISEATGFVFKFTLIKGASIEITVQASVQGSGCTVNGILKSNQALNQVKRMSQKTMTNALDYVDASWESSVESVANGINKTKCIAKEYVYYVLKVAHWIAII